MKIALVVPPVDLDGEPAHWNILKTHRTSIEHTRALGREGVDARLFVTGEDDYVVPLGEKASLQVVSAPETDPKLVRSLNLIDEAARFRPDVLHVFHFLEPATFARASLSKARLFGEYNGGAVPQNRMRKTILRLATRRAAGLFFTSTEIAAPFKNESAIERKCPIFEVPEVSSHLDFIEDEKDAKSRAGLLGRPHVLVVARVEPPKDPDCVLDTLERILSIAQTARATWASKGGAELSRIAARIAANPVLKERVELRLCVKEQDMAALYRGADVLVHPSRREVCGFAFVEALSQGLPIAASNIPAFRAMAADGAVSLCEPGDARAFAEAALVLSRRSEARALARQHFLAALSYEALGRRRLEIYRETPFGRTLR